MTLQQQDHYVDTNGIRMHYIEYPSDGPTIIFLHGLTANAHAFDGLVYHGIAQDYRIISVDLRSRGLTDYPAFAYSIEDHADDILGLLDHLKIDKAIIAGHSFGGLLSFYIAANYPERVDKLIVLDAAARMNPNAGEMLQPTLNRLDKIYPSWDSYIDEIKAAPFSDFWEDSMLRYYRADIKTLDDCTVTPRPTLANILQVAYSVANTAWGVYVDNITHPVILLNGLDAYTMGEPLLPDEMAKETVDALKNAQYFPIDGNHHTMLYGDGAKQIIKAIKGFIKVGA